jgi:hypothetical protein
MEYLVSERIRRDLIAAGARGAGAELRQALGALDDKPLAWFQILPDNEMPPMDRATRGIVRDPCSSCKRSGFFDSTKEPIALAYPREVLAGLDGDFARTYELFGNGFLRQPLSESRIPTPLVLVSPLVMDVLRSAGVKGLDFQPVHAV